MALKVKAVERKVKFSKTDEGVWRYVMSPELYIALSQAKVIKEAALRSGVSQGVMKACWDAAGEVIKAWATEGHSVALPGLGTMRFGLRAKSVENVNDVKTSLISTRRIIFTPNQDLKDELASTAIQITCYDRNGDVVKRVTSADAGTVEDPEATDTTDTTENGGGGSNTDGTDGGASGSGGSSQNQGGSSTGSETVAGYALTISTSGSGSTSITHDGNAVTSGASLNEDDEVEISITPAEGQVPTATLNGSEVELTESQGVYTGNFAMPGEASTLVINTGTADGDDGFDKD
ncbi:MAG: hypothetical protein J6Q22_01300 [Prevotella sp.]|nr:hypothetical protein [Prevotella sp.]